MFCLYSLFCIRHWWHMEVSSKVSCSKWNYTIYFDHSLLMEVWWLLAMALLKGISRIFYKQWFTFAWSVSAGCLRGLECERRICLCEWCKPKISYWMIFDKSVYFYWRAPTELPFFIFMFWYILEKMRILLCFNLTGMESLPQLVQTILANRIMESMK